MSGATFAGVAAGLAFLAPPERVSPGGRCPVDGRSTPRLSDRPKLVEKPGQSLPLLPTVGVRFRF